MTRRGTIVAPQAAGLRMKGRLLVRYDKRLKSYVAQSWTTYDGGNSPKQIASRKQFSQACQLIKQVSAADTEAAYENSKHIKFLPRDLLMKACYGTLGEVRTRTGKTYTSFRMAQSDIEALLSTITNTEGAMLVYSSGTWVGLIPGNENQVLALDANGDPQWVDALSYVPASIGEILYFDGTAWITIAPGTATQVLTINAEGVPAWEPPSGGGGGGGFNGYFDTVAAASQHSLPGGDAVYLPQFIPAGYTVTGVSAKMLEYYYGNTFSVALYGDTSGTTNTPGALLAQSAAGFSGPTAIGFQKFPFDTPWFAETDTVVWAAMYSDHAINIAAGAHGYGRYVTGQSLTWPATAPATTDYTQPIQLTLYGAAG